MSKPGIPKVFFSVVLLFLFLPAILSAEDTFQYEFGFYGGLESFRWEEFDSNDHRLLDETGARYHIGGFFGNLLKTQGVIFNAEGKIYFGTVDYDGQTQSGTPVESDVDYTGLMIEGVIGYRLPISNEKFAWDFLGGIGFDTWVRDIQDTTTASGQPVAGYEEDYFIVNLKIGTGPCIKAGRWQGQLHAGIKYPLYTYEYVHLEDVGYNDDVQLSPSRRGSAFLNFKNTIQINQQMSLCVDIYYDSYRFGKSDEETVTRGSDVYSVWQPESHMDVLGLKIGLSF